MNVTQLERIGACRDAVDWARRQPSAKVAWRNCVRGEWMLWALAKKCKQGSDKYRKVVLAACKCARLALPYVLAGEKRPVIAIRLTERWTRGDKRVTSQMVAEAAGAAWAARAAWAAAGSAAWGAAWAARAVGSAVWAAGAARAAAEAAAEAAGSAAWAAAGAAAEAAIHVKCAKIIRKLFPNPPVI